ncbi:hypothetical protein C7974DRAFT_439610 [Boeremia exigua]|uniref:uncharacterized protein n=1 Tax=Boeremia exigua TaxID=749465 RepID=UPI001E8E117D|nr:uncharacterized protein C7974DRAFT_439610 [Boeremia exigua]KAH6644290.1 hypothetical protein C7974DRAFT_439610 [Boeremia exigua]
MGVLTSKPLQRADTPFTSERKKHFEKLRRENVPRYLFRAWSSKSGGGPERVINSKTQVVPRLFLPANSYRAREFYALTEREALDMATRHYTYSYDVISGFSSWSASLHLVLCYAQSMVDRGFRDVHVSVMDTQDLDYEVLVWQCAHLLGSGQHEFLAYGPVQGRGYRAVRYSVLVLQGIYGLLPQLQDGSYRSQATLFQFGYGIRSQTFKKAIQPVTLEQLETAGRIARMFGPQIFPVLTALLCLVPRPWLRSRSGITFTLREQIKCSIERAGALHILKGLKPELWHKSGYVQAKDFPDVQQWIRLQRVLVEEYGLHEANIDTVVVFQGRCQRSLYHVEGAIENSTWALRTH